MLFPFFWCSTIEWFPDFFIIFTQSIQHSSLVFSVSRDDGPFTLERCVFIYFYTFEFKFAIFSDSGELHRTDNHFWIGILVFYWLIEIKVINVLSQHIFFKRYRLKSWIISMKKNNLYKTQLHIVIYTGYYVYLYHGCRLPKLTRRTYYVNGFSSHDLWV